MDQRSYDTMTTGRSMDLLTKNEKYGFWEKRTRLEQFFIVVCSLLTVLTICLIIAIIVLSMKQSSPANVTTTTIVPVTFPTSTSTPPPGRDEECNTTVCINAAEELKATINDSINPCDDFYSYVCSGWQKANQIPEFKGSYSTFGKLSDKITNDLKRILPNTTFEDGDVRTKTKTFYSSCLDNETRESKGVEILQVILQNLGGWPLLGNVLKDYVWLDAVAYAITELGTSPIISIGVGPDAKDTVRNIIQLDQPELGLGRNALINKTARTEREIEIMKAYKNLIKKYAQILGSKKSETSLADDIDDMIQFEAKLAEHTRSNEERRDPNSRYKKMTVSSLQSVLGKTDITSLLSKVFSNITEVTDNTEVIVGEFKYLYETSELLKGIKIETIANYIGWRVVQDYGYLTTQEFRDAKFQFDKVVNGVLQPEPLDDKCIKLTNSYLGYALGSIYINNDYATETKTEIENIIFQMKDAFGTLLKANSWMNEESKKEAENKLNAIIPMVAFPPWSNDTEKLNDYYNKLGEMKEDTFFENAVSTAKFHSLKNRNEINKPHNRTEEWTSAPAVVNAFYSPDANTITFPAGILNYPFYRFGLPPAVNFAGIGGVIGHEITHGFDDEGSQYDAEGNLNDWWPADVRKRFKNETQCFVEQYGNYTEPITGMKLNGEITLGENIADNGGIREAFKAYRTVVAETGRNIRLAGLDLTPDQLFFVSYAYVWCSNERPEYLEYMIQYNPHSPARFRVQVPGSNFEEFSNTFNCTAGSTMNSEDKCLLW